MGDRGEPTDTTRNRVARREDMLENRLGAVGMIVIVEGGLLVSVLCRRGDRWGYEN